MSVIITATILQTSSPLSSVVSISVSAMLAESKYQNFAVTNSSDQLKNKFWSFYHDSNFKKTNIYDSLERINQMSKE